MVLFSSIEALENDLQAIHAEHETQDRMISMRKSALDTIVLDLGQLRSLGRENIEVSAAPSPGADEDVDMNVNDGADGDHAASSDSASKPNSLSSLNPNVKPFQPRGIAQLGSPSLRHAALMNSASRAPTPTSSSLRTPHSSLKGKGHQDEEAEEGEAEEDIEMGEVSEQEERAERMAKGEDREEGEASDEGEDNDLSEHPNG